jgi:hypothetical protein
MVKCPAGINGVPAWHIATAGARAVRSLPPLHLRSYNRHAADSLVFAVDMTLITIGVGIVC